MKTEIIALTMPVKKGLNTSEELLAYCARVSNPDNQNNHKTASGLLRYLARNKHWSPFEMVSVTMEIETTRDISRQILRHVSFRFQEYSGRYAENLGFAEPREARLEDEKNRQNSIDTDDEELIAWWENAQRMIMLGAEEKYREARKRGIAKEQARVILPEGLTQTRMYMAGTLRSWIHYCSLRKGNGTQKEHIQVAKSAWDTILEYYPVLSEIDISA